MLINPLRIAVMPNFREKLEKISEKNKSLLCVGLDPDPNKMAIKDAVAFNRAIIDATKDIVSAYKPNLAFYEQFGLDGLRMLEATLQFIPGEIPVIGDAKRGDISTTSMAYARAMFEVWGFDALTVNPFLGRDSLEPFLAYSDKGIFVLCRTSNPGAKDFQDLVIHFSDKQIKPLYQYLAIKVQEWDRYNNLGLIVGATAVSELSEVRSICPDKPFLVPGIGAQEGDLRAAIINGVSSGGRGVIINVSRHILYASRDPLDFAGTSRNVALQVRDAINEVLLSIGKPW
jgi:orotidine-5'-phosphate decarboxylase